MDRTDSKIDTPLTQPCSLSDLRSHLIARRRRIKEPTEKLKLQLVIDQLKTQIAGEGGPHLPKFIKRQLALIAA